jgi:hypothetical protein
VNVGCEAGLAKCRAGELQPVRVRSARGQTHPRQTSLSFVCLARKTCSKPCHGNPESNLRVVAGWIHATRSGALERITCRPKSGADAEPFGRRHFRQTPEIDRTRIRRCVAQGHRSFSIPQRSAGGTPTDRVSQGSQIPTSYLRACFDPIASAMIAVTKLLMLTPSFSACLVSFE